MGDRFLLKAVLQGLVALLELRASLAQILPLGLRLLDLGHELLLQLDGGLRPGRRGKRYEECNRPDSNQVSHAAPPLESSVAS